MNHDKQLRILVTDGDLLQPRRIQIVNRSLLAFDASREACLKILRWPEAYAPGAYILFDQNNSLEIKAYVGHTDSLEARLKKHYSEKNFWSRVIFFCGRSSDGFPTKPDTSYLELRLHLRAVLTGRCEVQNAERPKPFGVSDSNIGSADEFFDDIEFVLGSLGYEMLRPLTDAERMIKATAAQGMVQSFIPTSDHGQNIEISIGGGIVTRAHQGRMVGPSPCSVEKGNRAILRTQLDCPNSESALRFALRAEGVLVEDQGYLRFAERFVFDSLDQARGVILGGKIEAHSPAWKPVQPDATS